MASLLTIARLTFREVFNKKLVYIVLFLTIAFLAVYGIALHYVVKDLVRHAGSSYAVLQKAVVFPQLLSMGLYFSTFMVALMAVFSTVNSLSGEIETGTIHAVLAKPLNRAEFVLGKALGYSVMMTGYASILYLGVVGIMKSMTGYVPSAVWEGLGLFLLIPCLLLTLSLYGSSFLSTMANGISVFMIYVIGTVGGMLEQIGSMLQNVSLVSIGIISSLIIPTDSLYRKMIFVLLNDPDKPINTFNLNPFATANPPSGAMIVYTVVYLMISLLAAVLTFNKRDI